MYYICEKHVIHLQIPHMLYMCGTLGHVKDRTIISVHVLHLCKSISSGKEVKEKVCLSKTACCPGRHMKDVSYWNRTTKAVQIKKKCIPRYNHFYTSTDG